MTELNDKKDVVALSEREIEVLQGFARGETNQQIAVQLDIKLNTVKVHVRNIFAKLGVSSRTEALMYAVRSGIIEVDTPQADDSVTSDQDTTKQPTQSHESSQTGEQSIAVADTPLEKIDSSGGQETTEDKEIHVAASVIPIEDEQPKAEQTKTVDLSEVGQPTSLEDNQMRFTMIKAVRQHRHTLPESDKTVLIEERVVASPKPVFPVRTATLIAIGLVMFVLTLFLIQSSGIAVFPSHATTVASPVTGEDVSSTWQKQTVMSQPRTRFGLGSYQRYIYVVGGIVSDQVTDVLERYNPESDTWTQLTSKPTPVADVQVVSIEGKLYVAGGVLDSGEISDSFEVYDPDLDEWDTLPTLPAPRSQYAAISLDGKLYLFGGWDGAAYCDTVWIFDPDDAIWHTGTPMPEARGRMGISVLEDTIHLIGGRNKEGMLKLHQTYDITKDQKENHPWQVLAPLPLAAENLVAETVLGYIYAFNPTTGEGMSYSVDNDLWRLFATDLLRGTTALQGILVDTDFHLFGQQPNKDNAYFHYEYQVIYRTLLPLVPIDASS